MDPQIKALLEENLQLAKDNNAMLHKIRGVQRWAQIYRVFYWIIIIALSFGSYYFIQPYIGKVLNVYSGGVSDVKNIKDIGHNLSNSSKGIQDLIDIIKK